MLNRKFHFFKYKLRHSDKKLPFLQLFKPRYDAQNKLLPIGFTDVKKFLQDNLFQEFEPVFLNELDIDPAELSDFLVEK